MTSKMERVSNRELFVQRHTLFKVGRLNIIYVKDVKCFADNTFKLHLSLVCVTRCFPISVKETSTNCKHLLRINETRQSIFSFFFQSVILLFHHIS